jgi:threonine/homoserine/homoserine lactone efflux protein
VDALLLGVTMGFAAGISPGPLLFLTISSSLRHGTRHGVLVALAHLVTDVVVVTAALLVLDRLPSTAVGVLGVVGGLFVVWTGAQTLRESRTAALSPAGDTPAPPGWQALRQGAVVNIASPHPWLFWATAMGPLTVATWGRDPVDAVALVAGFYLLLVGTKVVVAVVVGRSRHRLGGRGYRTTLAVAGALLLLAGLGLLAEFAPILLPA